MPSAELIGLQAPKKAHRSLVFALAAACRQIESAAEIAVQAPLERGPLYKLEPIITLTSLKRRDPCCTLRDVGRRFWNAVGSIAPHRFVQLRGFNWRSMCPGITRCGKAPSSLRSAGAVQKALVETRPPINLASQRKGTCLTTSPSSNRTGRSRPRSFALRLQASVVPSGREGSRYGTLKVTSSGSLDCARDDG